MSGYPNDLHELDPAALTWKDLTSDVLGDPPIGRIVSGMTSVRGKLYLFGGYNGVQCPPTAPAHQPLLLRYSHAVNSTLLHTQPQFGSVTTAASRERF
jgi:hypothetical protein